ncbi:biofilm PGA synthesis protein PgaB [bacterium]|nr:biofilm PGA synthesis protein PgaB [bacterium]
MNCRMILILWLLGVAAYGAETPIRVAVFEGPGVGSSSQALITALTEEPDRTIQVSRITADEIRDGKLADVHVLVHPGGSASKQGLALGEPGRRAVQEFVQSGGGYLGVCAGAYLATNDYEWSLNLIDAKVVDKRHWARGTGTVTLRLSPTCTEFFGQANRDLEIYYAQGPLLARNEWDDPAVPDYESLAIFATEITQNGAPKGVMAGTSAAVRSVYGHGRVFCFSSHPELTTGLHHWIPQSVEWLAAGKTEPNPR